MTNKWLIYIGVFLALNNHINGQVGGLQVYEFLNLPSSARITALGGLIISLRDDDSNLAYHNPALLNDSQHQQLNFNQQFHLSDITNGFFSYAHHLTNPSITVHSGIQYIQYGNFKNADEFGNIEGNFTASEMALTVGASKMLNEHYHIGANLKTIFSSFESYRSNGMAVDIGAAYVLPEKKFSAGLVIRNLGTQFTAYHSQRENLPFDIAIGISKQPEHLPLRLSITAHHLHRWNITYDDPDQENTRIYNSTAAIAIDNAFRHLVFNGEFLVGKEAPLRLRFGYDHFRRREMNLAEFRSFAGFSGGLGIKTKKWRIDYGFGIYHLSGAAHHLSFGTSVQAFRKNQPL